MKSLIILAVTLLPTLGFAKEVKLNVDTMGYSSPASMHLDSLQADLARQAVEACGSKEAVVAVNDIVIKLESSNVSHGVLAGVTQGKFGPELELNYPLLKASAVATCK